MKRRHVLISKDAAAQLEAIRSWWIANRPAAPDLFDRELDAAVAALGKAAQAFALYHFDADVEIRRLLLPRTRYAVYFSIEVDVVLVVAVWHGSRGIGPPLP